MTQAALAEAVGRTEDSVSQIERGLNLPTVDTLLAMAKALGVPVDYLISPSSVVSANATKKAEIEAASTILVTMNIRQLRLAIKLLHAVAEDAD